MRRSRDWIGRQVVGADRDEELGEVIDVLFQDDRIWYGLLLKNEGLLNASQMILSDRIQIDDSEILKIESEQYVIPLAKLDGIRGLLTGENGFAGKYIMDEQEKILGTLEDVYIGQQVDNIVGYEVSDGLIADLLNGRKWLPASVVQRIDDAIIVRADASLSDF